jgi:serine/threonine-protein kinase
VLYSSHTSVAGWDQALIRVATQPADAGKIVLRGGYHARYVPTGHLLYVHANTLYAIRFDLDRLETTPAPVAMIENIVATPQNGAAQYSIADNGTLAYVPGHAAAGANRIAWLTSDGSVEQLAVNIGEWGNPRFSPNGDRIAMQVTYGSHDQIAIYDLKSARLTQLTFDAANHRNPAWMPDGKSIIYVADTNGTGPTNIYWRLAHGSGPPQRLSTSARTQTQTVVHPNGRMILYTEEGDTPANHVLMVLPFEGTPESGLKAGKPRALTDSNAFAGLGSFSPDGRFVAYMSSEEGPFQVFVKALEGDGRSRRVSTALGAHPLWSSNNRELIYNQEDQLMSVSYRIERDTFQPEPARAWTKASFAAGGPIRKFDLHPDGKRMIAANPDPSGPTPHDTVVLVFNFFEELRRRVPATR